MAGATASPEGLEQAVDAFLTASRALVGVSVRSVAAAPVELTVPQHRLLVLLAASGGQAVGTLAERLGVNQSNASRLVDRLQRLGLTARGRAPEDGRSVVVSLTPAGRDVLEAVTTQRRRAIAEVLATMTPRERETAVRAMSRFNDAAHELRDRDWPG